MADVMRLASVRYGVAVMVVGLALLLQRMLIPWFGVEPDASPFMLFFAAVIVAAWFGGLGPGLLATALSAALSDYFFLSPQYEFQISDFGQGLRLVVFMLEGVLISSLVGMMHSARQRADASAQEARDDREKLRRNEERYRLSETRFRTMFEQSPLSIQILSPDGHTLRVNRAWEELWGVTLDDIEGYNMLEDQQLVDKGIMPYVQRGFAGEPTPIPPIMYDPEKTIPGLTGSDEPERWVRAFIYPMKDEAGNICEVVLIHEDVTERKRGEEALRRAEEKYRGIFENAVEGIFQTTVDGRFLTANPALASMFGYDSCEEMMAVSDVRRQLYVDPERRTEFASSIREQGSVFGFETRGQRKDGSAIWISVNARALYEGDELVGYEGMVQDVTGRKRIENALRFTVEASAALSSSLDYRETLAKVARLAVPHLADWCAVDVLEEDGSLSRLAVAHQDPQKIRLAHELQERYPSDPEASYGVPWVLRTGESELVPEITESLLDEAARDEEHREILREVGLSSYIAVPLVARGRTLGAITLVTAESGRRYGEADLELAEDLARRAAVAVDNARLYEEAKKEIAYRERAQEELRSSRDQLEIILRGVADGITAQDESGQMVYANEAAARIVGYPSAQALLEAPVQEVLQKFEITDESGRRFPLDRLPGRLALRGERSPGVQLRFREVATGEDRWAVVNATPVFDERGHVRFVVNIFRDITERKRAEEALQEVRKAERNRMARDLHDGTLQDLTYALAEVQLVQVLPDNPDRDQRLERVVGALKRAGQELRGAVYDLRLGGERERPFPELLGSLVDLNRRMVPDCEIELAVEEGFPSTPLGETGTELLRIVQEALTNVRRHANARKVLATLRIEGDDVVAEVADDGRGFVLGSDHGVGLKSMRERAATLGGELMVESEPGKGTRVCLRAPLYTPEARTERR